MCARMCVLCLYDIAKRVNLNDSIWFVIFANLWHSFSSSKLMVCALNMYIAFLLAHFICIIWMAATRLLAFSFQPQSYYILCTRHELHNKRFRCEQVNVLYICLIYAIEWKWLSTFCWKDQHRDSVPKFNLIVNSNGMVKWQHLFLNFQKKACSQAGSTSMTAFCIQNIIVPFQWSMMDSIQ